MGVIMEHPYERNLESYRCNIKNGAWIKSQFYNIGYWKENFIPKELRDKKWVPEDDKMYKYWWYHTHPSDPADFGEDKLIYIEEYNVYIDKPIIRQAIIDKLYELNDDTLVKILKYINTI